MIIATIITAGTRKQKSLDTIMRQMERIYKLYEQGYGTSNMMDNCEEKTYIILAKMAY